MVSKNIRTQKLIKILVDERSIPIKRGEIARRMNLSESSIRNIVRESEAIESMYGFQIELLKGKGYILKILDDELFKRYLKEEQVYAHERYIPEQRLEIILFHILQVDGYVTIAQLEEKMSLSRSTIIKELGRVEKELAKFNLNLERKAYHGISIIGNEQDYRKALSVYVFCSRYYTEPSKEYKQFSECIDTQKLSMVLNRGLEENNFKITDVAFENIMTHLKILIFRALQKNFISKEAFSVMEVEQEFYRAASYVIAYIGSEYNISFPDSEIQFLAVHMSAKTIATSIGSEEKDAISEELKKFLIQLDKEFLTSFQEDIELQEVLLLHMLPFLNRLHYNLQFDNPLIEEIYTKYSNIFVIAYRFGELIERKYGFTLSRGEVGYLALHFATHFERLRKQSLKNIKRIVVICTTGGGSAHLLRLKLEDIFSNAIIVTTAAKDISDFKSELPDLFLSTVPIVEEYRGVPIIHIKQFLDEEEIRRIKETVYLQVSKKESEYKTLKINELFSEKFFQRKTVGNYLEIVKEQGEKMIEEGFASADFVESVLEREKKYSTIYQNDIAGPHSLNLKALINSVGVTILEEPMEWQGRSVQLIFLINMKQGHLFLHKEVSRLLLYLIDNETARKKLINCSNFEQFMVEINRCI